MFSVEGVWASWEPWNNCSTTCGQGTQSRARNFTGGLPCTGNATDLQTCQSKLLALLFIFFISLRWWWWQKTLLLYLFIIQLKVRGQHGTLGVLVLVHVTLMQKEIGPEVSQMVQLHAQDIQLTQEVVQVLSFN